MNADDINEQMHRMVEQQITASEAVHGVRPLKPVIPEAIPEFTLCAWIVDGQWRRFYAPTNKLPSLSGNHTYIRLD